MRHWIYDILIALVAFSLCVHGFDDPISVIGRIRWNYTSYEENLWTREFKNTTLEKIYRDHAAFIDTINKVHESTENFYPTINETALNSTKKQPLVDAFLINPYHVPVITSVILSNAHVAEYWTKFANWSAFNASNMLDVLTDDAIPTLQTALDTLWNANNTVVYFNFLKNVRQFEFTLSNHFIAVDNA